MASETKGPASGKGRKTFEFLCENCGQRHIGSPSIAYKRPPAYFGVPEAERDDRVKISDDFCEIDGEHFFIRTILEIPIHGAAEPFTWGVWITQSHDSFLRYRESFKHDQSGMGSFGWLAAAMPGYDAPDADGNHQYLKCDVDWQGASQRPLVRVQETDHPLYRDQQNGISWERAIKLATKVMHV